MGGSGWTLSATRSELVVCRVLRSGMTRTPVCRARTAKCRVRFPGSIGVPWRVVRIRFCRSCHTSPAVRLASSCCWRRSFSAVRQRSGSGRKSSESSVLVSRCGISRPAR